MNYYSFISQLCLSSLDPRWLKICFLNAVRLIINFLAITCEPSTLDDQSRAQKMQIFI